MQNTLGVRARRDPKEDVAKREAPKRPSESVRIGPKQQEQTQTQIHVHRVGDRIESFVITCPCGEQVTVQCNYIE